MTRPSLGRDFCLLFSANIVSSLADGILRTAGPLLALGLTDDPFLISAVGAAVMLPWLVFAVPAGAIVDAVDKRAALAVANTLRTVAAAALAALSLLGVLEIWSLLVLIFILGIGETVYDTATRALVPGIVPRSSLAQANSRIESSEIVTQTFLAGPFTSTLLAVAALIPLGLNVLAFAVSAGLVLALSSSAGRRQPSPSATRGKRGAGLAGGFRFIFSNPTLRVLLLISMVVSLCQAVGTGPLVVYLVQGFGLPEPLFGLFMLTSAAGAVLGSTLAPRLRRKFSTGPAMAAANLLFTVPMIVVGLAPNLWVAGTALFASSVGAMSFAVLGLSFRQGMIPTELLGRVHGTWRMILWGAMPAGSLAGGILAREDLHLPYLVSGAVATGVAILSAVFMSRLRDADELEDGPATS
ncbi:MFS transporter (plasmid) [Rathayibacter sp. VKM Ac-2803]|uniref:MFS transporter n=1 Tax=Rathayibacter TaxID=33886 RepID=UPI001359AC03|nr:MULTISPECIES: MFS transporter [Rathayibacter]MWV51568.1 MFS transporter [Rathayibacter sp. VKM Ac-2803]